MAIIESSQNKRAICEADHLFITARELREIPVPTPYYLFDEATLVKGITEVRNAFSFCAQHYFPLRQCRHRRLLRLLREQGLSVFCTSPEEVQTALECGFSGEKILYGTMMAHRDIAAWLRELDATLVLCSPLATPAVLPRRVWFRYHTEPQRRMSPSAAGQHRNFLGLDCREIIASWETVRHAGAETVGLSVPAGHTNQEKFLAAKAESLLQAIQKIRAETDVPITHLDLGEGLYPEYERTKPQPDLDRAASLLRETLSETPYTCSLSLWKRMLEPGAILVTSVLGTYARDRQIMAVDVRPTQTTMEWMYQPRFVTVPGKERTEGRMLCDVAGAGTDRKCLLARNRVIAPAEAGDLLVFQDAACCVPPDGGAPCLFRDREGRITAL